MRQGNRLLKTGGSATLRQSDERKDTQEEQELPMDKDMIMDI
jgi:hypothetical protein